MPTASIALFFFSYQILSNLLYTFSPFMEFDDKWLLCASVVLGLFYWPA